MTTERPKNISFSDFVGGVQLLQGDDTKTALPGILMGICVSGAVGNVLVLLIFIRDFRNGRGSEVKALLGSLASTDLMILLLCAPVRAVTYSKQTWTLGRLICRTSDWFQHSCVIAKTLILAASSVTKHNLVSSTAKGPLFSPKRINGALVLVWIVAMVFPIPQMLFASLKPYRDTSICVSEIPVCASEFMTVFYKIYPTVTYVIPSIFTLAYYIKTLYTAVNHAPSPQQQSKVTLVLLCVSAANALMLLPEWGTFTWTRLGYNQPPVSLSIFAQVLLYACSALSPVILMAMYDDVRQGLVTMCRIVTCRGSKHFHSKKSPKANVPEVAANAIALNSKDVGKTFPDLEHFWTGRRNTQIEEEQDPIPWEREEKML